MMQNKLEKNTQKSVQIKNWPEKIRIFSGAQLKYLAFISMLIDHVNKALIYPNLDGSAGLQIISDLFDILGRIAFPLFMFLLVEGYFKTRSRWKYLLYLLGFGVISEVPFDLFTTSQVFEPNWNNIMFTLAAVLITIWSIDTLREKMDRLPKLLWYLASVVIVAVMCFAAMNLGLDYEHHAILIGYFMYIFHQRYILSIPFSFLSMYKEPWALLGFALTLTYNGKRGRQYKIINYCFYPAHLLILGLLRLYLGI